MCPVHTKDYKTQPTRIAVHLSLSPEYGGSFQYALSILEALARLETPHFEVRIFYNSQYDWRPVLQKMPFGEACALPPEKPLEHPLTIAAWNPRMCVVPHQYTLAVPPHIHRITPVHDLMHRYMPQFPEVNSKNEVARREMIYSGLVADNSTILVDSLLGKQQFMESYGAKAESICVLPFSISAGLTQAKALRPQNLPESVHGNFIFYPAQFWLHKNHSNLLQAVAQLDKHKDINCVFSGFTNKSGYEAFHATLTQLGLESRVHILGYVSDPELVWLYTHTRCLLMPTYFGPTNIPPLEAMHFGCPVAVSNNFAMPEQCGDAALYFAPDRVEEIALAIEVLWSNEGLRQTLIQRGLQRSRTWAPSHFADAFLSILYKALASV